MFVRVVHGFTLVWRQRKKWEMYGLGYTRNRAQLEEVHECMMLLVAWSQRFAMDYPLSSKVHRKL